MPYTECYHSCRCDVYVYRGCIGLPSSYAATAATTTTAAATAFVMPPLSVCVLVFVCISVLCVVHPVLPALKQ
jgi:AMMECR1 domain-containing protein